MSAGGADDAIKVMCRFRPFNSKEKARNDTYMPKFSRETNKQVNFSGKTYTFDRCFESNTTQQQLYTGAAKPIVSDVLSGYNGTIFAYGQTSSGKTHTMEGNLNDEEMKGVIPRIVQDIFEYIYCLEQNLEFHIKISYYEVYLDSIRDLLDASKQSLAVREDANRVPYVKGATERFVASPEEVMDVMNEGKLNRKVASTNMNADSSRSHSIFVITIKQENVETETKLTGKLYLVDLAGSEKVGKTGAQGETLEEAKNINKSLSALGNVISALAEGGNKHIPYRDSKMTRILQDSLGGNCRTTIIICCSPSSFNEAETKGTLMFGVRAKTIKNSVQANVELTAEQWRKKFEKEQLKAKKYERLFHAAKAELEKWRKGEEVSADEQVDLTKGAPVPDAPTAASPSHAPNAAAPKATGSTAATPTPGDTHSYRSASPASSMATSTPGVVTASDGAKVQELYNTIDEKEEQISQLSQLVESLKEQLLELEDLVVQNKTDSDDHTATMDRLTLENEQAKAEVNEVLNALEELAVNYDQKAHALDNSNVEVEKLANDLQSKQTALSKLQSELSNVTELSETHKKRASEMLQMLLTDMYDLGVVSPAQVAQGVVNTDPNGTPNFKNIDDEFTAARLLVSKVKSEVKTLVDKCDKLDLQSTTATVSLEEKEKLLESSRLSLLQHENKVSSLSICLRDVEGKRNALENQVSELHEEIARLRYEEQNRNGDEPADPSDARKITDALEMQKQAHNAQVERIRGEIDEKSTMISELMEKQSTYESELQTLRSENMSIKTSKSSLQEKLAGIQVISEKRDQAKSDLRGLEDTVTRELNSLHQLRKLFVKELTARAKKIAADDASGATGESAAAEDTSSAQPPVGSQVQRQRITFLENNLDQLTRVHKSLVRDNAELRCELPKLEKRLRATAERVKSLEQALRDAKEGASRDRKRYQQEVDRIKETVRSRYIARKTQIKASIAKPIRAGHAPGATFNTHHPVTIRGGGQTGIRGGAGRRQHDD